MIKFEPDNEHQKHRDVNGGVWFMQDGERFSLSGKHLGRAGNKNKPPKEDAKTEIRERASQKLRDFAGGTDSTISEALKENRASAAAEENSA